MYHHIGLPFFSQNLDPLPSLFSSYAHLIRQICLLSISISFCSVSFQIGHTKMDFFSFSLKFKYGQIVSSKTLNHRVRKQQQYLFCSFSSSRQYKFGGLGCCCSAILCECCCVCICVSELVMSACLWLDCVCVPLFRFCYLLVLNCNNCNRSGECVCIFSLYLCGDRPKKRNKK